MDTYTSITYSIKKENDEVVKKIEYTSTIKDSDKTLINTYYNNSISNKKQSESFCKLLKEDQNVYQQIGSSINKNDWKIQEYKDSDKQREYIDDYNKHNFDQCIMDCMPSLTNLDVNEKFLIDNK